MCKRGSKLLCVDSATNPGQRSSVGREAGCLRIFHAVATPVLFLLWMRLAYLLDTPNLLTVFKLPIAHVVSHHERPLKVLFILETHI